jgi:hypothetical protein
MSNKVVILLLLVFAIGMSGCRRAGTPAATNNCSKSTGPLTMQGAEQEALEAVMKEAGRDHACSVSNVKESGDVYEVCVRIDPPPSEGRKLPEHWTVEIPKAGVTQSPDTGGG